MADQSNPSRPIAAPRVLPAKTLPGANRKQSVKLFRDVLQARLASRSAGIGGNRLSANNVLPSALAAAGVRRQAAPGRAPVPARPPLTLPASKVNGDAVAYGELISATAKKHGVDPALVAALVKAESGFNPEAVSPVGAKGLMQLMDGTARSLGVENSFDPAQNLDGGIRFIAGLLKKYGGDLKLAIAGYNAGPGAVDRYGGVPPYKETQTLVSRVLGYMQDYQKNGL